MVETTNSRTLRERERRLRSRHQKASHHDELLAHNCCVVSCVEDFSLCDILSWTGLVGDGDDSHSDDMDCSSERQQAYPQHEDKPLTRRGDRTSKKRNSGTGDKHRKQTIKKERSRGSTNKSSGFGGWGSGKLKGADHPPPVIALSRSSFSTGSDTSTESALETTEVDRDTDSNRALLTKGGSSRNRKFPGHNFDSRTYPYPYQNSYRSDAVDESVRKSPSKTSDSDRTSSSQRTGAFDHETVDFAARHELLINALFEDAKHRHEQRQALEESNHYANNGTTPPRSSATAKIYQYPSSNASQTSKSRHSQSSHSNTSTASVILSPASHQFKPSLNDRKRRVRSLKVLEKRTSQRRARRMKKNGMDGYEYDNHPSPRRGGTSVHAYHHTTETSSDHSSCTSLTNFTNDRSGNGFGLGDIAHSFLHTHCQLQKDSGKGSPAGTAVTAHGRENAMAKLVEKMDLLAEVEQEGSFANAVLTRVPAKNMTSMQRRRDFDGDDDDYLDNDSTYKGFIETRSMLAVKMGFMSLRYGVLVHWNRNSGLAELIVLRKMCSDAFMKIKSPKASNGFKHGHMKSSKSWRKRMRKSNSGVASKGYKQHHIPATISADSRAYESDDLTLEAVASSPY